MLTINKLDKILGCWCALEGSISVTSRHKAKYIFLDKDGAWISHYHCKAECEKYLTCDPKPYLVVPVTDELLTALKLVFKNLPDNRDPVVFMERTREVKKFIREWVKK